MISLLQVGSLPHDQNCAGQHAGDRGRSCTDNLSFTLLTKNSHRGAGWNFAKLASTKRTRIAIICTFLLTPVPPLIFFL
jgi:hypothetical protein